MTKKKDEREVQVQRARRKRTDAGLHVVMRVEGSKAARELRITHHEHARQYHEWEHSHAEARVHKTGDDRTHH